MRELGIAGNRDLAAAIEAVVHGPFGAHPQGRGFVVKRGNQPVDALIVAATLDADRALPDGRQADFRAEELGDAFLEAEPFEPGGGEDDGIVLIVIELLQAGVDVAAQIDDL